MAVTTATSTTPQVPPQPARTGKGAVDSDEVKVSLYPTPVPVIHI